MRGPIRGITAGVLAAALLVAGWASEAAGKMINDDLVVQKSACIGGGCKKGESFGFDTLRFKGDVLRIQFKDTSSAGSFPSNDWRITINDADAGTRNRFSIDDVTAGTTPFTIEAGGPSHSLYIGGGQVGIGTSSPAPGAALHVNGNLRVDGDVAATGATVGLTGVKAGVIPAASFTGGTASVAFASPYASGYVVLLTSVSTSKTKTFRPAVLSQDANGFTVSQGGGDAAFLVEVDWMTQPVSP